MAHEAARISQRRSSDPSPASRRIPLSESVEIRAVQGADFLEWKQLWDGYNAFYGRVGDTALAPDITLMTWSSFFDGYEPMHALVAQVAGRIVGRALIEAVYAHAKLAGAPRVYWQTHETNTQAMRLYDQVAERSGFVVYRRGV
jgi:GNAT superfamily N-acetyltransferase